MHTKYRKVAYRGKRLSAMTEDELREALYQVYVGRKSMHEFAREVDSMWDKFDAAFASMRLLKWPRRVR